jgi:tRNA nucleotidyltransferase (CCA-adding enzyme)
LCCIKATGILGRVNAEREYVQGEESSSVWVIPANPDQSKHLETATLKVHGLPIDFVHLRNEQYSHDSRIPAIEVGTPLEDAERRDFTINALFYNLHTRQIEDLTGKGLKDLENGIIRTPLEPHTTFLDGMPYYRCNLQPVKKNDPSRWTHVCRYL